MSSNAPPHEASAARARKSALVFKGSLLSLVAAAFIIPLALAAVPFIEFFNGMAAQPKAKAQMPYGRVHGQELLSERAAVAGTVPRGYVSYPFDHLPATIEGARQVGPLVENPLPRSMENMRRGQELYDVYCIVCHGKKGVGDGSVTGPNRFPAPPSLHTDQARGYADGAIYHMITKGTEKMPPYGDKLEPDDRWNVVHYLRALQRAMNPRPEDLDQ